MTRREVLDSLEGAVLVVIIAAVVLALGTGLSFVLAPPPYGVEALRLLDSAANAQMRLLFVAGGLTFAWVAIRGLRR